MPSAQTLIAAAPFTPLSILRKRAVKNHFCSHQFSPYVRGLRWRAATPLRQLRMVLRLLRDAPCNQHGRFAISKRFLFAGMKRPSIAITILFGMAIAFGLCVPQMVAQTTRNPLTNAMVLIVIEGTVEVAPRGSDVWAPAKLNQRIQLGERLRTGKSSRATLRSSAGDMPVRESSLLTIAPPRAGSDRPIVELVRGFFYFFTRGQPTDIEFKNRLASAAARGTEFTVAVDDNDRIEINVFDGVVDLTNAQGSETATNGEQVVAASGQRPAKSPALSASNLVQWVLYYPGVLDVDELALGEAANDVLRDSLAAYRRGDLVRALNLYPEGRLPANDNEKIYRAALVLVVGEVDEAKAILDSLAKTSEFSIALRKLIAAVRNEVFTEQSAFTSGTAWLADSYYQQSRLNLDAALTAARSAAEHSPQFGFAWARVAELEFSFGRIDPAFVAVSRALKLSPRHAPALALTGFLLAAQNRIPEAIYQFDQAIEVDGALSDAWLGRGLCRIRRGDRGGLDDLRTAAALEPNRAVLRSYLAKGFDDAGRVKLAEHELNLSRRIDPNDPTVWLYSALHNQQQNRINDAIRDLEHSQDVNNNRAVYRSQMLLDQDRAVRSANLASIYYDAGMTEVSVREAGRAVTDDYANYSSHLFLANSYERLRDPKQINLRYETPAFAEYLIANLLAPVGAGPLSPAVSQQEYSKLFERDHLGVSSRTEYDSGGNWFEEGAQYGTVGNTAYSVEGLYRSDHGQRFNNDIEQRQFSVQLRQQLTPHDTLFVMASDYHASSGDVAQYYYPQAANPLLRTREEQEPIVVAGFHHEWSPGNHTLFLGSRLDDTFNVFNRFQPVLMTVHETGPINGVTKAFPSELYESEQTIYSGELQQIFQRPAHTSVIGGRWQVGDFDTDVSQTKFKNPIPRATVSYASRQDISSDFERITIYGYHTWEIVKSLQLIGGVAYDDLTYPNNFRFAPVQRGEESTARVSPKAGLIWTATKDTTVRLGYAQGIGGASIDQSYQIEPSQVAGFNQSFRSIIPESVAAANAGARFESAGVSLEHKFPTETYAAISGAWLESRVNRDVGAIDYDPTADVTNAHPGHLREHLDYRERSLALTLNQLVGEGWAFGARYRVSEAELRDEFPGITPGVQDFGTGFKTRKNYDALLHQVMLYAIYNHPSGLFTQWQAVWTAQETSKFSPNEPGDDFWQFNVIGGYRWWQRRAEVTVGVLNITDEDYKLEPLTLYNELPRERTFMARFSFKF
jgi:tetratricopeptide (TPR) repeat protein